MAEAEQETIGTFTEEQGRAYLARNGVRCIACEAITTEGGPLDVDDGAVFQHVKCLSCGAEWSDIYHLVGIMDEGGNTIYVEEVENQL